MAHPAFARIIEQLSRDEAAILAAIAEGGHVSHIRLTGVLPEPPSATRGSAWEHCIGITAMTEPSVALAFPERLFAYIDHLISLNLLLLPFPVTFSDALVFQAGDSPIEFATAATPFGQLFITACVPNEADLADAAASVNAKLPSTKTASSRRNRRKKTTE